MEHYPIHPDLAAAVAALDPAPPTAEQWAATVKTSTQYVTYLYKKEAARVAENKALQDPKNDALVAEYKAAVINANLSLNGVLFLWAYKQLVLMTKDAKVAMEMVESA